MHTLRLLQFRALDWFERNSLLIYRLAILAALLGLAAAFGLLSLKSTKLALLGAAITPGVAGLLLLIRYPNFGLVVLIPAAMAVPFSISTGSETKMNAAVLMTLALLGLWVFEMIVEEKRIYIARSPTVLPGVALVLAVVMALLFGQIKWFPIRQASIAAQVGATLLFVISVGAFLLVANRGRNERTLQWMVWGLLAVGSVFMVLRLYLLRSQNYQIYLLVDTFFGAISKGSMFWTWLMAMAFSQMMYNRKLHLIWRGAMGVLLIATLYISVIHSDGRAWTSGWMPGLAAMGVIAFLGFPRLAVFGGVAGMVVAFNKFQSVINAVMIGDNQYSLDTRTVAWDLVLKIAKANPIFGVGPANYYWYTPLFPILGYAVQFNSHNNYVDLIAQVGVVGLACYLWFMLTVGVVGWRLLSRTPEGSFARAFTIGALGGLVGTLIAGMLGDWVIPFVYNIGYYGFRASVLAWLFLGGIGLLEQLYPENSSAASSSNPVEAA
jgi:O-antigen ligase